MPAFGSSSMTSDYVLEHHQQLETHSPSGVQEPIATAITSLKYNRTGDCIAVGDKSGYINVLQNKKHCRSKSAQRLTKDIDLSHSSSNYEKVISFRSHETEFDYLKSELVDCAINQIEFCRGSQYNSHLVLATNNRTIKLWKVYDKRTFRDPESQVYSPHMDPLAPRGSFSSGFRKSAMSKKTFASAHSYHINSLSCNSDGETFLSADDLRVNVWNLNYATECFNVMDMKPERMEDLQEVITTASFHPTHCHQVMFSTSAGVTRLGDMRQKAMSLASAKIFQSPIYGCDSIYSDVINSTCDAKFTPDGRYIVTRDFLTLKVWDVAMENRPVTTIAVHDNLRDKLGELYHSQRIFDKFSLDISSDGNRIVSGSYDNRFHIFDRKQLSDVCVELNSSYSFADPAQEADADPFSGEVLVVGWNPTDDSVAVSVDDQLYTFSA